MNPLSPLRIGEGTPGGPSGHNLDPTATLRLGVLATTEGIADQMLPQIYLAGETHDS